MIDGVSILGAEYILAFKAKAWLDLTYRKGQGEVFDSNDIKKHRKDIFRVYQLLSLGLRVDVPDSIKEDMSAFVTAMHGEKGLDVRALGINNQSLEEVLDNITLIYGL